MRILLVSNLFPPYVVGGYERLAGWVAEGLRARGHAVQVLTGRGALFAGRPGVTADLDLDLEAVCHAHFADGIAFERGLAAGVRRHVFSPRNLGAARRALAAARADLVSFWNPAFITLSPLLAARWQRVPSVVHLSDTVMNPFRGPHPPAFPPGFRSAARLAVDALLPLSAPRRYLVPSAFLRDKLVRNEGLPARRSEVLPWPLPPAVASTAPPARGEPRASRLLFVGSLAPEKGADVLLEAFRRACTRRPDLTLTVLGDAGRASVRLLRASAEGLAVRFGGQLAHDAVLREYQEHDVLVFPSVWDEPFALVPLEAAAMGLAVVATTAGGTPEAFTDGRTALLVPPGDAAALEAAILRLAGEPPFARALATAAQAHVRATYDFQGFMDRLEAVYEGCRTGRGSAP
jgi:glycogen synthase